MRSVKVSAAFIPLVDAAPLILAEEMGFAEAEGISLDLVRAPSWSSVRDMLAFGRVDAAHLLSPVPIAMALGVGGVTTAISAVMVMSVNGNVIGVSNRLAARMRDAGFAFGFEDAAMAGQALKAQLDGPVRFGIPFPFSMHHELLRYWFDGLGLGPDSLDIRTIPPPLMADALGHGEIDAFCVGEPWGSMAVERNYGELILPGSAIWKFSPEKVLAIRTDWAEAEPMLLGRIMRSVWRTGEWLARPESAIIAAEVLSRPEYLDVPAEVIDRALSGQITISPRGDQRQVDRFIEFYDGAASFPWRSQAAWICDRLAARAGMGRDAAISLGRQAFRPDLYRQHLSETEAVMPGASEKLEGSIRIPRLSHRRRGG